MANNMLFLIKSLESSKCLFEVWLFNKGVIGDKIAMIAVPWKIFRPNVLASNPQQSCIASLHMYSRLVAYILIRVFEECTLQ